MVNYRFQSAIRGDKESVQELGLAMKHAGEINAKVAQPVKLDPDNPFDHPPYPTFNEFIAGKLCLRGNIYSFHIMNYVF